MNEIAPTETAICIDTRPGDELIDPSAYLTEGRTYEVLGGMTSKFVIVDNDRGARQGYAGRRFVAIPRNGDVLALEEIPE